MKKILSIIMAATMLFAFAGCGEKKVENTDTKTETQTETPTKTPAKDSDLAEIKDKGKMVIGITEYEPMDYKDENGEWTGFDAEFARAACEKLGVEPEFIVIDWDNKALELDAKSIDCVWNGMTLTDKVEKAMECSKPYVKNAQVVVMAADKVADYKDAQSMKDLKFVAEASSAGEGAIKDAGLDKNYTAVAAQTDALMEVASGSSDACVIDITMANAMTGEGTSYANLKSGVELTTEEYVIGFRKGSDAAAEINKIMDELKADGTLDKLAEKYKLTLAE